MPKAVLATMELLIQLETHIDDFKKTEQFGGIELMAMGAGQFSGTSGMFDKDFVAGMYGRVSFFDQYLSISRHLPSIFSLIHRARLHDPLNPHDKTHD